MKNNKNSQIGPISHNDKFGDDLIHIAKRKVTQFENMLKYKSVK